MQDMDLSPLMSRDYPLAGRPYDDVMFRARPRYQPYAYFTREYGRAIPQHSEDRQDENDHDGDARLSREVPYLTFDERSKTTQNILLGMAETMKTLSYISDATSSSNEDEAPPSLTPTLDEMLQNFILWAMRNGISQGDEDWHTSRRDKCGGSSIATFQGINPFRTLAQLLAEKCEVTPFEGRIAMWWGSLFETAIKKYVEIDRRCTILGENLYLEGPPGSHLAYSPDGLAVMDVEYREEVSAIDDDDIEYATITRQEIVLLEFKCPFTRIPRGTMPSYYVPQVKMGLDMIDIATSGLFAEAVFRKCSYDQIMPAPKQNMNILFDRSLDQRPSGKTVLACGLIGFYDATGVSDAFIQEIILHQHVTAGVEPNIGSDIGQFSPEIFTELLSLFASGQVQTWNSDTITVDSGVDIALRVKAEVQKYNIFCGEGSARIARGGAHLNVGMMAWKLFRVDYHVISKESGYLAPWSAAIKTHMSFVGECLKVPIESRSRMIANHLADSSPKIFSDEYD